MLVKKRDIQSFAYMGTRIQNDNTYLYQNKEGTVDFKVFTSLGSERIAHV